MANGGHQKITAENAENAERGSDTVVSRISGFETRKIHQLFAGSETYPSFFLPLEKGRMCYEGTRVRADGSHPFLHFVSCP